MESVISAAAREDAGGLSLPAMTIIAMLLLMLPYLIRRYSGKSVTELLRPSVLMDGAERLFGALRGALLALFGLRCADRAAPPAARPSAETTQSGADGSRRRAANARNDYLKTMSDLLTFARRNRLFAIIPGNLAYQGRTAELDALLVTRARVVGILTYSYGGTIACGTDGKDWTVTDGQGTRRLKNPTRRADEQDELVRCALRAGNLGDIPYRTVMLFTGSDAVLTGERAQGAYTREELLRLLGSGDNLNGSLLDPRETGKKIGALCAGKATCNNATNDLGEGR